MSKPTSSRTKKVSFKTPPSTTRPSPSSQIPAPFTLAPSHLTPFLDQLDPAQVYLTHIDRLPVEHKKTIYTIPVLLNFSIALLLLWRASSALPTYWALILSLLGYTSSATVDTALTTRSEQFSILARRTLMFTLDFLLVRFVGPWPLSFFFEQPANPVTWRWGLGGFRAEEAVVRVSRHWGAEDLMRGVKQGEESPFFKTRILPAIERELVERKTGYLLMDRSWDLDFQGMLDVHTLVEKRRELKWRDVDRVVWVFAEGLGWLCWRWEGDDPSKGEEKDKDVIEERRKKVVALKEKLVGLGKEGLFWRWMEILEEERDADGGFSQDKQVKVAQRVQQEFEKEGVDFEELARGIGGLGELPNGKT